MLTGYKHYEFKVLIVGDPCVGKSSLIRRYVKNEFSFNYKATVGIDFMLRQIELENGNVIHLQLWDIAGQERFHSVMGLYCRGAHGIVYVFDSGREATLDHIVDWKISISRVMDNTDTLPSILLANKSDKHVPVPQYTVEQCETTTSSLNINLGWSKCSAFANYGLEDNLLNLAMAMVERFPQQGKYIVEGQDEIDPDDPLSENTTTSCCFK